MRAPLAIAVSTLTLLACGRPAPATAPRPVAVAAAPAPAPVGRVAAPDTQRTVLVPQTGAARQPEAARGTASVTENEVTRRVTEVFGADVPREEAASADAEGEGPSWDIAVAPYETHKRVEHFVRHFTGPARDRVESRLARGSRYEAMIREKMRAGGVPEDMYYLAFVESGFDTHAYSRAAAVGMWQFMTSTAKGMGLRVDWWVDERRDPIRATDAAVRFLRALNTQFGSMYLAAAAYNGGPGRVARGLTRFAENLEASEGEDRFFDLAEQDFLPKETKDYVPQIIAAALVGKEPGRYGLEVAALDPFAYDSVTVPALTSIPAVARAAGTTVAALRDLNPQFLRGVTPPEKTTRLRIPVGTAGRFDTAFAALSKEERVGVRRGRVEKLSSMARLADRFETSARAIEVFNPGLRRSRKGNVVAGQTILIPDADVLAATLNIPDPSIERYGSSSATKAKGVTRYHMVKRGETLSHVAVRYRTSVKSLMRLNRLKKPVIFPGQELVVVGAPSKAGKARAASSASGKRSLKTASAKTSSAKKVAGKKSSAKQPTGTKATSKAKSARKVAGAKKATKSAPATAKKTTGATSKK